MRTNCRILQEEAEAEAVLKINTQGCIPRIQTLIENNLYPVVGVAIGVAVSQVSILQHMHSVFQEASWNIYSSWSSGYPAPWRARSSRRSPCGMSTNAR